MTTALAVVRMTPEERRAIGRAVVEAVRLVFRMGPMRGTVVVGGGCLVAAAYLTFPTWWDRLIDWWDR